MTESDNHNAEEHLNEPRHEHFRTVERRQWCEPYLNDGSMIFSGPGTQEWIKYQGPTMEVSP